MKQFKLPYFGKIIEQIGFLVFSVKKILKSGKKHSLVNRFPGNGSLVNCFPGNGSLVNAFFHFLGDVCTKKERNKKFPTMKKTLTSIEKKW